MNNYDKYRENKKPYPETDIKFLYTLTLFDGKVLFKDKTLKELPDEIRAEVKNSIRNKKYQNGIYKIEEKRNPEFEKMIGEYKREDIRLTQMFLDDVAEEFGYVNHPNREYIEARVRNENSLFDEYYQFMSNWSDILFTQYPEK